MYTTTQEIDGKFHGVVRSEGEMTLFRSPGYVTERMALADARCWVAFHGEEDEMSPELRAAYELGLKMRAKMDAENTVTVSSGTHVLPWEMAHDLRKPSPHPRNGFPGTLGRRMLDRQQLFKDVAAHLGITYSEAQTLPRVLRAQKSY